MTAHEFSADSSELASLFAEIGFEPVQGRPLVLVTVVILTADTDQQPRVLHVYTARPAWSSAGEDACIRSTIACLRDHLDQLADPEV